MKFFVYILLNTKGKHYTGITKKLPKVRLLKHNKGEVRSTKFGRPWKLIYQEEYKDMYSARQREIQIKSWHGGTTLTRFLNKAAGSSNGRTTALGAVYERSSRSPAALFKKEKKKNIINLAG